MVGRDLLGGQRVGADVAHCRLLLVSRGAGRSPPVRWLAAPPNAHRITRSSSSEVPVIRCGVLRGMKQMSPGPRSRRVVADDLRAAAADDHHHLLGVRVVVVLVRRAVRVGRLAERDQRRAGVRRRRPSGRRDGRTAPRVALRGVVSARSTPAPPFAPASTSREERRASPPRSPRGASSGSVCPTPASSTTRALAGCRVRARGRARAACGRRSPPTSTSAGSADLVEPAAEALRGRDRTALADVVGGVVLEQEVAVLVEHRPGRARATAAENGGFFDQSSSTHASSPIALDPLGRGEHARREVGEVRPPRRSARAPARRSGRSSAYLSAIARAERVPDERPGARARARRAPRARSAAHRSSDSSSRSSSRERAGAAQVDADEPVARRRGASQTRFQSAPERPSPWTRTTGMPSPADLDVDLGAVDEQLLLSHSPPFDLLIR